MSNISDPRVDAFLQQARQQAAQPAVQLAVFAMTPEMYIATQVLAQLSQGILKSEEAYTDESLPGELIDKSVMFARELLKKLG